MSEREKTLALGGFVGAVLLLGALLVWNIGASFRHECRPAVTVRGVCVVCGSPMPRSAPVSDRP
jgi:hypothetical protein